MTLMRRHGLVNATGHFLVKRFREVETRMPFIHNDFMLQTAQARALFHDYARDMPILDYHCHLPPDRIADDYRFRNITDIWLGGDHYKWRAMRTHGVPERFCTGNATDREKFFKWAETVPALLRNPLYHWTHLELARYFGVECLLSPATAEYVWETCNARLQEPEFTCRELIRRSGVRLLCTTDDPVDDLASHQRLAADPGFDVPVLPTWRPDKGMAVEDADAFNAWIDRLAEASDRDIRDWPGYLDALDQRHAFFHSMGCRLSDHGLETISAAPYTQAGVESAFRKVRGGGVLNEDDVLILKSALLYEFAILDHRRGWAQQFHLGAMRNNNSRMRRTLGPDTGFDSIGDFAQARPLASLLDRLDAEDRLTRTILYNLNPADNAMMATMIGNFQDGSVAGKIQWGSAWWFLDQKDGMESQLEALSQMGLLSRFVGMLTDSRSFLSYTRHEYFRRILCNLLGRDMAAGLIPDDLPLVGGMVRDVAYRNAVNYFGFPQLSAARA